MRQRDRFGGRRDDRDAGFSLMEIVVALGVFTLIAVACARMAVDSLGTAGDNRERVRAANLADQEIELVRAQFRASRGGVTANCLTHAPTVSMDGGTYTVACAATWLDAARAAGPSGSPLTAATGDVLRVDVTVTWPNMDIKPVINTTLLS